MIPSGVSKFQFGVIRRLVFREVTPPGVYKFELNGVNLIGYISVTPLSEIKT